MVTPHLLPEPDRCPICYDNLGADTCDQKTLACNHTFHVTCLLSWIARCVSCPMCRRQVLDDEINGIELGRDHVVQLMESSEFSVMVESFNIPDNILRAYMTSVHNDNRSAVITALSTCQTLDERFIADYINELDLDTIIRRRDELGLSDKLVDVMRYVLDGRAEDPEYYIDRAIVRMSMDYD